ncbi:MAG TPA: DUF5710 domain-containing protein [Thiobacillaceae bacterium]|nr:DUF5710 domain-containing protein [Thiobacillaceae bacterium]HNI08962.1 DUF5710 domain-containing protein [Thiobacillaceae bacterium]
MNGQPNAKAIEPSPALNARVSKRLTPGQNGTKRLQAEYGNALVCVRYRLDGRKRYTTVELVIDEQELPPPATRLQDIVAVTIGYQERALRDQAKKLGAHWDAERRVWLMPRSTAKAIGLEARIQAIA